mmetsp:Transcript_41237/g.124685  ORF Transcript_41237/g.124685 Transcript_41237/m.124685 type:complete len:308 (-) Transcript_41237:384-1307(-)
MDADAEEPRRDRAAFPRGDGGVPDRSAASGRGGRAVRRAVVHVPDGAATARAARFHRKRREYLEFTGRYRRNERNGGGGRERRRQQRNASDHRRGRRRDGVRIVPIPRPIGGGSGRVGRDGRRSVDPPRRGRGAAPGGDPIADRRRRDRRAGEEGGGRGPQFRRPRRRGKGRNDVRGGRGSCTRRRIVPPRLRPPAVPRTFPRRLPRISQPRRRRRHLHARTRRRRRCLPPLPHRPPRVRVRGLRVVDTPPRSTGRSRGLDRISRRPERSRPGAVPPKSRGASERTQGGVHRSGVGRGGNDGGGVRT